VSVPEGLPDEMPGAVFGRCGSEPACSELSQLWVIWVSVPERLPDEMPGAVFGRYILKPSLGGLLKL